MLIVENLHLLLTRADGRAEGYGSNHVTAEIAALLTDLVVAERVVLTDEKRPRVEVFSTAPTGHPVLDSALPLLAERSGQRLERLVMTRSLDPRDAVRDALVARGVLTLGERTMLGLGAPTAPEANPEPEQMLRAQLAAVLAGQAPAGVQESTILGILQGMGVAHRILEQESGGLRAGQLKKVIAAVVERSPAGTAVERTVAAMTAAMMSGVMAASISSSSS